MANTNIRNLIFCIVLLGILIAAASYAFSLIEGIDLFSSLYQIILIVTTVGAEYEVTTFYGKILIMVLLAFGIGLVFYIAIFIWGAVIEGQTRLLLGGIKGGLVRMRKEKDHIIVCGYGKLGKYVCNALKEKKEKYVIIEKSPEKCTALISSGESILQGDALDPEFLKKAGISKAKGLIATLGEDSENIYLIMTATDINPKLDLAAKAEDEHAVDRLHKVGAKIVVLPQVVGGKQLANAFLEMEKTEELETISKKK
ncbi:potassium channel family protein [Candidatus Woesearchaeota archaeon]|nr:potassium channel family protein [Candidatus Woesearchaeota archaeon]